MATEGKYITEPTPHSILARHYGTHSAKRVTSVEDFNRDGEVMGKVKALFLEAERRWREDPTEYRRQVADRVKKFAFWKSAELKKKHWPQSSN
jgi:hypothetical protein